ncbi:MAG: hypothetical protein ACR2N4_01530 [Jatrophihabitans sp.]
MVARQPGDSVARPSWATDRPAAGPTGSLAAGRQRLGRWREGFSFFDTLVAIAAVAAFDLLGVLVVTGWQTIRCGDGCGLRTQLHLMHLATILCAVLVVLPPLLCVLLLRRVRLLITAIQVLLCLGIAVNVISTQHRLVPRIHGTARCWNPLYSNAEYPWGPTN